MAYLTWLFHMWWWYVSLLLFDRSKLDSTTEHSNSLMNWLNEFIWWLIKLNSLKKVRDTSLQNLFNVSTSINRCGDRSTPMVDEMSSFDDLSSWTHWRRFVMHLCRTFPVFPHSYQSVAIEWGSERMSWEALISGQNPHRVFIHLSPARC